MIDWEKARETVRLLGEGGLGRPDEDVLRERAAKLSHPSVQRSRPSASVELVLFDLGSERFGVETSLVIEVFRVGDLTPLPHAPDFVRGLTNRLGEILPVLDLAPLLGLSSIEDRDVARCLLLGRERRPDFGLLVSEVTGVGLVPEVDLLALPEGTAQGTARDFVRGVTVEALIVLDGDRMLRDPRLVVDLDS